jgi:hypothetical protein
MAGLELGVDRVGGVVAVAVKPPPAKPSPAVVMGAVIVVVLAAHCYVSESAAMPL